MPRRSPLRTGSPAHVVHRGARRAPCCTSCARREPVVEIEQHRRALRRGAEHVAEVAEHVRPNRVALVLGDVVARRAFAGEDVEVVEPEIDQHFFELALAVDRAQQLRFFDVGDHLAVLALSLVDGRARIAGSLRIAGFGDAASGSRAAACAARPWPAPAYSRWMVCESSVRVSGAAAALRVALLSMRDGDSCCSIHFWSPSP